MPNLKLYDSIAHPERELPGTPVTPGTPGIGRRVGVVTGASGEAEEDVVHGSELVRQQSVPAKGTIEEYLARESLEPYLHVRHKLPIDDDKRPSVSCELLFYVDNIPEERRLTSSKCDSVEHSKEFCGQRSYKNFLPCELQRVHFDASANG